MSNPTPSPPRPGPAAQEGISEERLAELPALLEQAERRVNAHVWCIGGDDSLASIPANHNRDVDLLLMEAAKAIRHLRRQTQSAGWRPIETAPKGGGADYVNDPAWVEPPLILLRFPNAPQGEKFCVAHWDWYYAEGGDGYDARRGEHGAWIEPISGERVALHYDSPTGWQTLPAAPEGSKP